MRTLGTPASSNLPDERDGGVAYGRQDDLQWSDDRSLFFPGSPPLNDSSNDDPTTWSDTAASVKGSASLKGNNGRHSGGSGGGGGTTPPPPPPPDPNIVGTYSAGAADGEAGYDIRIDFIGTGWTDALEKAFKDTADYFTKVITADIGGGQSYNGIYIDDLYITAELKTIDGSGGILGQGGPTGEWSNELTEKGLMQFDSADAVNYLNAGLWDDIVTHEMMHVLGFGTLWNYGANPLVPTAGQYIGKQALAAYQAAGHPDATYIPVESNGAHWSEAALGNELMTPYISGSNYLSSFSLMSLADLGYNVQPLPWSGNPVA